MRYFNPQHMLRPLWEDVEKVSGYWQCTCGNTLQTRQAVRDHWQQGHLDIPAKNIVERPYDNDE